MNATKQGKSVAQSSISNMSVAEVRRALSFIRKAWEDQNNSKKKPLYLSDDINVSSNSMSIEQFSLLFVLAHHTRRLSTKSTAPVETSLNNIVQDDESILTCRPNIEVE